jgi:hypothetical protein
MENTPQSTKIDVMMAQFPSLWPNSSLARKDAFTPSDKNPDPFPRPILTHPRPDFVLAGLTQHTSSIARGPQNIDDFASTVLYAIVQLTAASTSGCLIVPQIYSNVFKC